MQQRRLRPGDVLDDYCPRERRITGHAIVAMIEDHIKQTRCVVCDAEHEYKEGKVPPQRRKKAQPALFTQVLDGLQGPQPPARPTAQPEAQNTDQAIEIPASPAVVVPVVEAPVEPAVIARAAAAPMPEPALAASPVEPPAVRPEGEGFFRRSLIRATLPRPEGQQPPARAMPEFTVRQPTTNKRGGHRAAGPGRRRGGAPVPGGPGASRFVRGDGQGQRPHGRGGHGQNGTGRGHQGGRSRRGKKK